MKFKKIFIVLILVLILVLNFKTEKIKAGGDSVILTILTSELNEEEVYCGTYRIEGGYSYSQLLPLNYLSGKFYMPDGVDEYPLGFYTDYVAKGYLYFATDAGSDVYFYSDGTYVFGGDGSFSVDMIVELFATSLPEPENDVILPVINGQTNYISNVDNPVTVAQIKSGLSAVDNVDGNIPSSSFILVSDGYTSNNNIIGIYDVKFKVSDTAGNEAEVTVKVHVVDVTKPVITGTNTYTVPYNQTKNLNDIKNSLTVTDNYDTGLSAVLVNDGYTANKTVKGTYDVTYKATDSSGNESSIFTVQITVIDNIKPIMSGQNAYSSGTKVKLLESNIRQGITASDDYDGTLTVVLVQDNYSANYKIIGTYAITYRSTDESGNQANYVVTVTVTDDVPPVIYTSDAFINVPGELNMTIEEIIAHLVAVGDLVVGVNLNNYEVDAEATTYDPNNSEPGEYEIVLMRTLSASEDLQETIVIGVEITANNVTPDQPGGGGGAIIEEASNFFATYGIFIVLIIVLIVVLMIITSGPTKRGKRR